VPLHVTHDSVTLIFTFLIIIIIISFRDSNDICSVGDAEKARTENAAPKCRGGNGENGKVGK